MRYHRFDFPDLPIDAFKHYGDRRIKPQGPPGVQEFFNNPIGATVDAASNIVNGAAQATSNIVQGVSDVVHDVTAPIIDPALKTVADVGQGVSDVIHDVGTTVAKSPVLNTAAVIALTPYIGEPAAVGLVSANAGASPENVVKNMVLAGVSAKVAQSVAPEVSSMTGSGTAGTVAGQAAGSATTAALTGRDPIQAALNSAISGGVTAGTNAVLGQVDGYSDLTPTQQRAVSAAVSAELQGKDPTSALIQGAINIGKEKVQDEIKYAKYDNMDFGVNQGAVDKVNAEQAQNDFYDSIKINPDTVKDTAPASNDVVDQLVNAGMQETPPTVEDIANIGGQPVTTSPGEKVIPYIDKQIYGIQNQLDTQAQDFMKELQSQGYSYQDALTAATQEMGDRVSGVQTQLGGLESKLDAQSKSFMDQLQSQGYSYQDALTAATQEMGDRVGGLQTQFETQLNDYGKSTMDALQKQGVSYTDALNAALQQQNEAFNSQFSTLDAQNQQLALDLVKQGYTYDEALQGAMQSQAEQLSAVQQGLQSQIGGVQQGLQSQIKNTQSNLGSQIGKVGSGLSQLQTQVQTQNKAQQQQNNLQNFLSLLALDQPQQQQQTQQPVEGAKVELMENIFGTDFITPRPEGTKKYSSGGEIEALLHLLRS